MGPNRTAGAPLIGALARPGVGGCRIVHVPHTGSAGSRRTGHALRARLEGAIGAAVAVEDTPGALGTSLGQRKRQRNARGRGQDDHSHRCLLGRRVPRHHPNISQRTGRRIGHRRDDSATVAFLSMDESYRVLSS